MRAARCFVSLALEGFGLPVLEAMQCGAPVVVGDNSSLVEIVDRPDLRCDTKSPRRLPGDDAPAARTGQIADARRWALDRARTFSWTETARRAWDALDEADAR